MPVTFVHNQFALCTPAFHLPKGSQDEIKNSGAWLIAELQRVGWDVPDINVTFRTYGSGSDLFRVVDEVWGVTKKGPYCLSFNGKQESAGNWNVNNQLNESIVPPGIVLRTWDDQDRPSVSKYTGKSWRAETVDDVRYSGSSKFKNAREFRSPDSKDLAAAETATLHLLFELKSRLESLPSAPGHDDVEVDGDANLRRLARVEPIPAPASFPTLYVRIRSSEVHDRLPADLDRDDYDASLFADDQPAVLIGNGPRLVSFGCSPASGGFSPRANDGFEYATTDIADNRGHPIHHHHDAVIPVEVNLRNLNDIFVVDTSLFDKTRTAFFKEFETSGRDRLTNSELDACTAAVARSMVPASEYDGSYTMPTYLIGRQVGRDEARIMSGRLRIEESDGVKVIATDAETGAEFEVFDAQFATDYTKRRAEREMVTVGYAFAKVIEVERNRAPAQAVAALR